MKEIIEIPKGARPRNDREAILLSTLQAATAITKERRRGHYINFDSRELRRLLGSRYAAVLRNAQQAGLIDRNHSYSVGNHSKSMRLARPFRTPETEKYSLRRPMRVGQSRIRLRRDDTVARALAACFDRVRLPDRPTDKGWKAFLANQIRQGVYHATRCQFGRFHSSFTGLPKELRLTLCDGRGARFIELDVRNCQPLICALLARDYYQEKAFQEQNHHPPTSSYLPDVAHFSAVKEFMTLCEEGELYDFLVERSAASGMTLFDTLPEGLRHKNRPLNRKDLKKQFLILMFNKNEQMQQMPLFHLFAEEFPDVAAFMIAAKSYGHQALARDCQRRESRLMIDGVAADIVATGATILTVHDAILCLERDETMVRDSIARHLAKLGCAPTIKCSRGNDVASRSA